MSLVLAGADGETSAPSPSKKRFTRTKRLEMAAAVSPIALGILTGIFKFFGLINNPKVEWIVLAATVFGVATFQEQVLNKFERRAESSVAPKVNQAILDQWSSLRTSFGLGSVEAADIRQFPVELAQLQELQAARERLSGKKNCAERKKLDKGMRLIIQEVLEPLAASQRYLVKANEEVNTMVQAADTKLANSIAEIRGTATRQAAKAHADHLLRGM